MSLRQLAPEVILARRRTKDAPREVPCEQALQAAEDMPISSSEGKRW